MKHFILPLIFSLLAFGMPAAAQDVKPAPLDFGPKEALTIKTKTGEHVFNVEVAETDALQSRGYMFRDAVGPSDGMIFEFEKPKVATIWMKNTGIFLDVLFIRKNGKILKIEHNAKPYSLRLSSSEAPVAAVVELAGGRAAQLGIRPGDIVEHDFFATN